MSSIFDLNENFMKINVKNYTRQKLIAELELSQDTKSSSDYEYRAAKDRCEELFPMTFVGTSFLKNTPEAGTSEAAPKDLNARRNFEHLQFLYYIITKNRMYKEKGFSVFGCIESPSERYLPIYNEMIFEIRGKVCKETLKNVDGQDTPTATSVQPNMGQYDNSIHALLDFSNTIAASTVFLYGENKKSLIEHMRPFRRAMKDFEKPDYPTIQFKSCWDELYFRLNYARCIYWESDMLWARNETRKMAQKPLPEDHKYYHMRDIGPYEAMLADDYALIFDSKTKEIREFKGSKEDTFILTSNYPALDDLLKALIIYIEKNKDEITKRTFRVEEATKSQKKAIQNHIYHVCEYFKMEFQRYGRNAAITKVKLVSAFQAVFLLLPQSGIAPSKDKTPLSSTPKGLRREKNTLSSSYSNSDQKEPRYLQLICSWTGYQTTWNYLDPFYAKKYLAISIAILKAMTAVGYESGMENLQFHVEKVLLAAMETLIPDEDGEEYLEMCIRTLSKQEVQVQPGTPLRRSLLTFGKISKLFGSTEVFALVEKALSDEKGQPLYVVSLEEATENALRILSPRLWITYDESKDIYTIQEMTFFNKITNEYFDIRA